MFAEILAAVDRASARSMATTARTVAAINSFAQEQKAATTERAVAAMNKFAQDQLPNSSQLPLGVEGSLAAFARETSSRGLLRERKSTTDCGDS